MAKIRIALVGVGNCASSLVQGIAYYKNSDPARAIGLMHWDLGGYLPGDIEVAAAFDIDKRKVGRSLNDAVFARPNCTTVFHRSLPQSDVAVRMGKICDGCSAHFDAYDDDFAIRPADASQPDKNDVIEILRSSGAEIMLNYLPVGSEEATRFYAECALEAAVAFVNNIPVFIASDPAWAARFEEAQVPLIGDDIKAQLGATITHRALTNLFKKRGVKLDRTYQLNTGGNTDFLNMLNRSRLSSKKTSKTEAVQSVAADRLDDRNIHIGPSDYVSWQNDNKVCFIRMEGRLFGDVPMNLELRLSVEDSPNSAGVAVDSIRCCKLGLDRGVGGVLTSASAYLCKHPPQQYCDDEAWLMVEEFIAGTRER
ncbi:MAG: inositol-3-phosphate synthase [Chitinivibrionales bacterium]|nr:inositol-3-phosphate synthase [Chitinivibrionales bacterium]